ncbi:MAG: TIGR04282 family arsenosugar biosynthesis glycosyltransferase [Burkholderiales bacterium]
MKPRILVFAKAPVPGQAKTRLISRLGAQGAARLQAWLIKRTLATATAAQLGPVELWCAPDCNHAFFAACSKRHSVALADQGTGDLGERMHRALDSATREGAPALLVGCDCPALSVADLQAALTALEDGADLAFIPAEDGGYVLIGAKRAPCLIFHGVAWGTGQVMAQTRERMLHAGVRWVELATHWDLDRPADYDRLVREGYRRPEEAGT